MTAKTPLTGLHAIVTAGPTAEPLDPVRVITNRSSGKQGYAIADALAAAGARVTLVSGPVQESLPVPTGVKRITVERAAEMLDATRAALPTDILVCAAAVADWQLPDIPQTKQKKGTSDTLTLTFIKTPDILAVLSAPAPDRPRLVIGFAAETAKDDAHLTRLAQDKLARKGCDWLLANNVSGGAVFGATDNRLLLVTATGTTDLGTATKTQLADQLVTRISDHFTTQDAPAP